jgi:hypothetical protein
MGYLHIENLYKYPDIFLFKEVYALEKIHGTSAHVGWKDGEIKFFSGGEKHESFVALFDVPALTERFTAMAEPEVVVFGEAYGGKCQGMKDTYGDKLRFVAFDVKIGDSWLNVPNAVDVATKLGFEFVDYARATTDVDSLNVLRDAPSTQAIRNGCGTDKKREGVVLRPLSELRKNNGERIITKHKRDDFRETKTPRDVDMEKLKVLEDAQRIAEEWVTEMRLQHVLDKTPHGGMEHTGAVIRAMVDDIKREGEGEIVWSPEAERAVGTAAAKMYKRRVMVVKT